MDYPTLSYTPVSPEARRPPHISAGTTARPVPFGDCLALTYGWKMVGAEWSPRSAPGTAGCPPPPRVQGPEVRPVESGLCVRHLSSKRQLGEQGTRRLRSWALPPRGTVGSGRHGLPLSSTPWNCTSALSRPSRVEGQQGSSPGDF